MKMDVVGWGVVGGIVLVAGIIGAAIYYDSKAAIPSPEQIQNLESVLPEGCTATDIGSYGKIDNMVIITCEDHRVDASYTYMYQKHGKSSETDRAAVFMIYPKNG
jgi:hypothetical protein